MSNVEEEWQPKQEYLNTLLSMGITHNTAVEVNTPINPNIDEKSIPTPCLCVGFILYWK